jgi:EmrB/QacA subfamily drug resistance transporter
MTMETRATRRRWWTLGALMLAMIVVGLDQTVLNVALPTLASDLHASTAQLQWIVDAYILVLAGLLLPLGALADRVGRRRTLLSGVTLFVLGSAAAAYAGSPTALIVTRAVMGLGAAVILTTPLAVLGTLFSDAERPKAIASSMIAMGLGLPLGPLVGGWLLEHYWWGSVFLINVPVGALALVAIAVLLPETRDPHPAPTDALGSTLSTAGLVTGVYAIVEAPSRGWSSATVLGFGALGLALLAAFAWWQATTRAPLIDLRLFARPRFGWGTACATIAAFAMLGLLFVLPLYLQVVQGLDPLATGIRLLPMILGLVFGAKAGERLTVRSGARLPIVLGLTAITGALVWGSTVAVGTGYATVAGWLTLVGIGMGLTLTPAMDAALGEIPRERAGSGTALTMALRQVGGALGVAVLGSVLNGGYTARLDVSGLPASAAATARESVAAGMAVAARVGSPQLAASVGQAFVHAMSLVMLTSAGLAVVGIVVAATVMPARAEVPRTEPRESVTIDL